MSWETEKKVLQGRLELGARECVQFHFLEPVSDSFSSEFCYVLTGFNKQIFMQILNVNV